MFGSIREIIIGAAGLLLGGTVVFFAAWAWNVWIDNPAIHEAGRTEERLVWQEEMRRIQNEMDNERRAAQSEIDRIEREYLDQRDRDLEAIQSLEEELATMEAEDAASPDNSGDRPPALSRRLAMRLNEIGRDQN
jgi:hypothetical protein